MASRYHKKQAIAYRAEAGLPFESARLPVPLISGGHFASSDQRVHAAARKHAALAFETAAKLRAVLFVAAAQAREVGRASVLHLLRVCIGRCGGKRQHRRGNHNCLKCFYRVHFLLPGQKAHPYEETRPTQMTPATALRN